MEDARKDSPEAHFRLGKLAQPVAARGEYTQVIKRDLERYYHALAVALKTITLTDNEALLICDALNGTLMEPHTVQLLWAQVDDACRLAERRPPQTGDKLCEKWDCKREVVVELLRDLSYCQALAVVDAVERAWRSGKPMGEAIRDVGLVR